MDGDGNGRSTRSRLLEPEMLVALSAVVLGLCALIVSVVQVQIMREEQHAAVWPRIQMARSYSSGRNIGIIVVNPGIGPAVIKDVRASIDGEPVTSWGSVLQALVPDEPPRDLVLSSISGRIIPAGEVVQTLFSADPTIADGLAEQLHRLDLRICYCSVYDECWWVSDAFGDESPEPEPAGFCPTDVFSFTG